MLKSILNKINIFILIFYIKVIKFKFLKKYFDLSLDKKLYINMNENKLSQIK
jgi:hypothetical protein